MNASLPLGAVLCVALAVLRPAATAQVNVDASDTHQLIRGFGGATVFVPTTPLAPGDLDLLFGNGPGQIGLTLLRIRVASDEAWRAVELANAQGAIARGANVIAPPWSPPAAMKSNNSLVGGSLLPSSYGDYAAYLNTFANFMAANGAPLYAVSVQNEPDITVTYESCDWTSSQLRTFCRANAGAITATRVIMPESFQFNHALSDPTLNDPVAAANISIVGGHLYGGGLVPYPLAVAQGKETWMTEHLDLSTDWPGALATGKEIHDCLATANFNAYIWWYLRRYYGPLGEDSRVTPRGYVMAQFAKFIRPGFVRIGATANPAPGISVSAYRREKLVIVALNQGTSDVSQSFAIANARVASFVPWVTSNTAKLAVQAAIPVNAGSFTATLPASSITTFVGDLIPVAPADGANQITNLSSRGSTAPGSAVLTGGLVIVGPAEAQKTVLLRGAAFSLYSFGIKTPVAKPRLTVYDSQGKVIATQTTQQTAADLFVGNAPNANSALQPIFNRSGAFPFVPDGSAGALRGDVALVLTLTPNLYTFTLSGDSDTPANATAQGNPIGSGLPNAAAGVVLLEVYDVSVNDGAKLANLSTRGQVTNGQGQLAAGFVFNGSGHKRLLVRGVGPALGGFGVAGALSDPTLKIFDQTGSTLIQNTGWDSTAQGDQVAQLAAVVGAFTLPNLSSDSAALVLLPPGQYTAGVQSVSSASGVALIEIYDAP